mgnify:CR=1 FL=1
MAIPLPPIDNLLTPLQQAVEWLSGAPSEKHAGRAGDADDAADASTPEADPAAAPAQGSDAGDSRSPKSTSRPRPSRTWRGPMRAPSEQRAVAGVRVVRVVEERVAARAQAGRMVISGRLADVCAELERLAALESVEAVA